MSPRTRLGRAYAAALTLSGTVSLVAAGPCDIYGSAGNTCVAAHSTTRALYDSYSAALYQVTRSSDGKTTDIEPLVRGGVANASTQDVFCAGTTCTITAIYDQSGHGNNLTPAPPGGNARGSGPNGYDLPATATMAPVTLNGQKAYGVYIAPGDGYRNDQAVDTAKGNDAQGLYAIFDGTHYNDGCCFDYGNAETSNDDTGDGHMQSIYFGTNTVWGSGAGSGPWIMADLENGLFSGSSIEKNNDDPTQTSRFVTAAVKGNTDNHWAIRGADSTADQAMSTYFSGVRPNGYNPMSQEGAIILGIGGDNSDGAEGTFYEGAMTAGYPSDDTENAVQANILSARYAAA